MTTWLDPWKITRLKHQLGEIPGLYVKLDATERQPSVGVRTPPVSKPPMRLDVITLTDTRIKTLADDGGTSQPPDADLTKRAGWRSGVLPTLSQWVRLADGEMHDADFPHRVPDDAATVDSECAWLAEHHQWLVQQQWVDELADEVHRLHRDIRAALGLRPEYQPRCRECMARLDPMDGATWYSCPACGREYTIDADLKALGQIQSATARDCAIALGLSFERLRQWIYRGQIAHDGRDSRGRKLYDLDMVRRVAERLDAAAG